MLNTHLRIHTRTHTRTHPARVSELRRDTPSTRLPTRGR